MLTVRRTGTLYIRKHHMFFKFLCFPVRQSAMQVFEALLKLCNLERARACPNRRRAIRITVTSTSRDFRFRAVKQLFQSTHGHQHESRQIETGCPPVCSQHTLLSLFGWHTSSSTVIASKEHVRPAFLWYPGRHRLTMRRPGKELVFQVSGIFMARFKNHTAHATQLTFDCMHGGPSH